MSAKLMHFSCINFSTNAMYYQLHYKSIEHSLYAGQSTSMLLSLNIKSLLLFTQLNNDNAQKQQTLSAKRRNTSVPGQ